MNAAHGQEEPMKVTGPNGLSQTSAARGAKPSVAPGFSLTGSAGTGAPTQAATARGASGVSSLDALIALQQVDSATDRRRRAVRRADRILDVLDQLKLGLLDGAVSPAALRDLDAAVKAQQVEADEPGLKSLLREIETRAAVELAKLEMSRQAA